METTSHKESLRLYMIVKVFERFPRKTEMQNPPNKPSYPTSRNQDNQNRYEILQDGSESSKVEDKKKSTP